MPIMEVTLLEGRSAEDKRAFTRGVTEATVAALGVSPEQVRIIIREIPAEHFAVAGISKADSGAGDPGSATTTVAAVTAPASA